MNRDKIFFFSNSDDLKLLGFYHIPEVINRDFGIVYTHPFGEEQNRSQSVIVKTARHFADNGIPVMRFDMRGFGDSQGNLQDYMVEDWIKDINEAIELFKNEMQITKVGLWGLRLGSGLNILASEKRNDIVFHIFWQPVNDFSQFIKQFIRQKLSTEISSKYTSIRSMESLIEQLKTKPSLEIMGYKTSFNLYNSFISTGNVEDRYSLSIPAYIASISLMDKPAFAISRFAQNLKNNGTPVHLSHLKTSPFWDRYWQWTSEDLHDDTQRWLDTKL